MVSLLLQANASVDLCDFGAKTGTPPHGVNTDSALMIAAAKGDFDILKRLLKADAKVEQADNNGSTALMLAAQDGHTATLQARQIMASDPPPSNTLTKQTNTRGQTTGTAASVGGPKTSHPHRLFSASRTTLSRFDIPQSRQNKATPVNIQRR